jgi:hypothetical protein
MTSALIGWAVLRLFRKFTIALVVLAVIFAVSAVVAPIALLESELFTLAIIVWAICGGLSMGAIAAAD